MIDTDLLEEISRLGFPLMEITKDIDVNKTLAEVIKSKNLRLWEGFPVLLANAAQNYYFDYDQALDLLESKKDKYYFHVLFLLALALYKYYHLSFPWLKKANSRLSGHDVSTVSRLRNQLAHDQDISFEDMHLEADRIKNAFNVYFEKDANKTKEIKKRYEELSLEYALSQVFSPKQKELFKKKLKGLPFTKTEREYYSRTVKRKVSALANPELHRLAQKLMEY